MDHGMLARQNPNRYIEQMTVPPSISKGDVCCAKWLIGKYAGNTVAPPNTKMQWRLLPRISQMTSFAVACDLRNTPEKQGSSANSCQADRETQWVTAKGAICGSVLTAC
jgi:hypothetical protein